jgi:hypothetical protein
VNDLAKSPLSTAPSQSADPVRVFILDDHEVVRRGARDLLEARDGVDVVGEWGRSTAEWAGK